MKELEDLWNNRSFELSASHTKNIAATFQPDSYADWNTHPDFLDVFERFTRNDKFRGMDFARIWGIILNIKHSLSKSDGSIAELGVYKGQCSSVLSYYAEKFGRKMYLADTFQGFAENQFESDMGIEKQSAFKDTSLDDARLVVGEYPGNRWVVGLFPDSITDEMRDDNFSFVSIDCDLYEPIKAGLEFFWPRLLRNGTIFIHDYSSGHWPGATRAVDEFCERHSLSGTLLPDKCGSFILVR
jgi:O-methyltransferase